MRTLRKLKLATLLMLGGTVVALLFLMMACGPAATSTPTPTPTKVVVPTATSVPPTATPTAKPGETPKPTATATPVPTATPTATPKPTAAPTATPTIVVSTGKVTVAVDSFGNERLDPAFSAGQPGYANFGMAMNGLLLLTNQKSEMIPGIASKWGLSSDGLSWTFTIRKNVKFQDGTALTPDDVMWSFQHFFGPESLTYQSGAHFTEVARQLTSITKSGDDVIVTTKTPEVFIATDLSELGTAWWGIMPAQSKVHDTAQEAAWEKNPVSAGPMKLVKHVPAALLEFQRFSDYYYQPANGLPEDRRVKFQTLDLVMMPEEATRIAAMMAGEIDLAPISLPSKKQVESAGARVVFAKEGVTLDIRMMSCGLDPKLRCYDKRVRQALDYTIDRQTMRDKLWGTEVMEVKGWGPVTPSTIGYSTALDPYAFDPAKGRQLLADAGFPGGAGFGTLVVNVMSSSTVPNLVDSALIAADTWKRELGIDVQVKTGEPTALKKASTSGQLNGQIWWRDNTARVDAIAQILGLYGPDRPDRYTNDPAITTAVTQTAAIIDPTKQPAAYNALYLKLRDESYLMSIGYVNIPWAVGARITAWQPYPLALNVSALYTLTVK